MRKLAHAFWMLALVALVTACAAGAHVGPIGGGVHAG
jgi:hypothetical protein